MLTRAERCKDKSALKNLVNKSRFSTKQVWEIDTNVTRDVVLYAHHNPQFHKLLNIFALTQVGFWLYLAEFSVSTLKDVPVSKQDESSNSNLPWYRSINLGENKYRRGITTMCVALGRLVKFIISIKHLYHMIFHEYFTGILILGGSWMFSLKSVKNIVLRKGGNHVSIITYAPFNKVRYVETPLKNVR
jgi:hypothetical protein